MKVRSARLTSVLSLVVLKSFRALPAVVCGEERGKEDELEGGGGGGIMGYPPPLKGPTHTHTNTGSAGDASQHYYNNESI